MLKHVCNICGKDFDLWDEQENFSIRTHVGYGSEFDGSRIELDMCCDCFDKLMNTYILPKCKIPPSDGWRRHSVKGAVLRRRSFCCRIRRVISLYESCGYI